MNSTEIAEFIARLKKDMSLDMCVSLELLVELYGSYDALRRHIDRLEECPGNGNLATWRFNRVVP